MEVAASELPTRTAPLDSRQPTKLFQRVRQATDWRVAVLEDFVRRRGDRFALLFVSLPRFQLQNSLFLERFIVRKPRPVSAIRSSTTRSRNPAGHKRGGKTWMCRITRKCRPRRIGA